MKRSRISEMENRLIGCFRTDVLIQAGGTSCGLRPFADLIKKFKNEEIPNTGGIRRVALIQAGYSSKSSAWRIDLKTKTRNEKTADSFTRIEELIRIRGKMVTYG